MYTTTYFFWVAGAGAGAAPLHLPVFQPAQRS